MPETREPKGPVRAVGKAMELIELLLTARRPLTLQELYARSGYPKSTIHALLSTLREYAVIEQTADGRYSLGIRLYEWGSAVSALWDVKQVARPFLERLAQSLGASTYLSVRSGDHVLSIDQCASFGAGLQVTMEPGLSLPLHATAQGKLLLSAASEAEVRRVCRITGLRPFTRHTLVTEEALLSDLAAIRQAGYAVEDGEYRVGLRAVAAPVYDSAGSLCYAAGALGLFPKIQTEEFRTAIAKTRACAAEISRALGYRDTI